MKTINVSIHDYIKGELTIKQIEVNDDDDVGELLSKQGYSLSNIEWFVFDRTKDDFTSSFLTSMLSRKKR